MDDLQQRMLADRQRRLEKELKRKNKELQDHLLSAAKVAMDEVISGQNFDSVVVAKPSPEISVIVPVVVSPEKTIIETTTESPIVNVVTTKMPTTVKPVKKNTAVQVPKSVVKPKKVVTSVPVRPSKVVVTSTVAPTTAKPRLPRVRPTTTTTTTAAPRRPRVLRIPKTTLLPRREWPPVESAIFISSSDPPPDIDQISKYKEMEEERDKLRKEQYEKKMEAERFQLATEIFQQANRTVPKAIPFPSLSVPVMNTTANYSMATDVTFSSIDQSMNATEINRSVIRLDLSTGSGIAILLATLGVGKFLI
jgi:hypothetical protein